MPLNYKGITSVKAGVERTRWRAQVRPASLLLARCTRAAGEMQRRCPKDEQRRFGGWGSTKSLAQPQPCVPARPGPPPPPMARRIAGLGLAQGAPRCPRLSRRGELLRASGATYMANRASARGSSDARVTPLGCRRCLPALLPPSRSFSPWQFLTPSPALVLASALRAQISFQSRTWALGEPRDRFGRQRYTGAQGRPGVQLWAHDLLVEPGGRPEASVARGGARSQ